MDLWWCLNIDAARGEWGREVACLGVWEDIVLLTAANSAYMDFLQNWVTWLNQWIYREHCQKIARKHCLCILQLLLLFFPQRASMIAVYGNWCRKSGWNRRRRDGTETSSFDSLTVRISVYAEGLKYIPSKISSCVEIVNSDVSNLSKFTIHWNQVQMFWTCGPRNVMPSAWHWIGWSWR